MNIASINVPFILRAKEVTNSRTLTSVVGVQHFKELYTKEAMEDCGDVPRRSFQIAVGVRIHSIEFTFSQKTHLRSRSSGTELNYNSKVLRHKLYFKL